MLLPGLQFYYQAFLDLSTCRSIGMAEGPIPWDSIDAYSRHHDFTDENEYDRFFLLIRALDAEYLRYRERQSKKNIK